MMSLPLACSLPQSPLPLRRHHLALLAVPLPPALIHSFSRSRAVSATAAAAATSAVANATTAVAQPKLGYRSTAEEATAGVDLTGKIAIVTGASSGIGAETARVLALRGASVVLAVRNTQAGEAARAVIIEELEGRNGEGGGMASNAADVASRLTVLPLDLQSLASVRSFADRFLSLNRPLHILVNNAGVMMCPFLLTSDGVELQFGTNHLGHFHLTNLLMPALKQTASEAGAEGRVVIVSSMAHAFPYRPQGICFDRLMDSEGYDSVRAYGQSKLANTLHARELARRLKSSFVPVSVNSLHPGVIKTGLDRHIVAEGAAWGGVVTAAYHLVFRWFMKTVPQGAATSCYLAASPDVAGITGRFFLSCEDGEKLATDMSRDMELAKLLWEKSEEMVQEIEARSLDDKQEGAPLIDSVSK